MKVEHVWEKGFGATIHLKVGKWFVGFVEYDGCRPRNDPKKYRPVCSLPGIKKDIGHFESEDLAKTRLVVVLNHWFEGLGL